MICCENVVKILWTQNFFLIPPQISAIIIYLFFSSPILAMHCHNCHKIFFFFSYFDNGIATIGFFFSTSHFEHTAHTLEQADRAVRILVITLPKFMHSLSPIFSLSHTFVEFRQWCCRNSLSLLILLNKLEQYL